jgi:hypothetical protein
LTARPVFCVPPSIIIKGQEDEKKHQPLSLIPSPMRKKETGSTLPINGSTLSIFDSAHPIIGLAAPCNPFIVLMLPWASSSVCWELGMFHFHELVLSSLSQYIRIFLGHH